MANETYDVFVSYSRADSRHAAEINSALRAKGLKSFFDRRNLTPGLPWVRALEQAIGAAKAVIVLIGPRGLGNTQQYERELALVRQSRDPTFPVVPVILPDTTTDRPFDFLNLLTWVDFSHVAKVTEAPDELARLLAAVHGAAAPGDAVREAICPYRGLDAFREEDAAFFFGRGSESEPDSPIGQLVRKVREEPFVMVVGRSGSGKSSLIYAGLLPALRRERDRFWNVLSLRPGPTPLRALAAAFNPRTDEVGAAEYATKITTEAEKLSSGDPELLSHMIREELDRAEGKPDRLLLYIDQWEELYAQGSSSSDSERAAQHTADVNRLIDLVLTAARMAPVTVVATVRADFYDPLIAHQEIRSLLPTRQILLGAMSRSNLERTIVEPARKVGLTFDPPDLVQRILDEAGEGEGMLPLLQYALKETWALRKGNTMTGDSYARSGGVREAIRITAERAFEALSAEDQQAARQLFLRLVTPGEGQEDTRARAAMPLEPMQLKIVEQFAGPRTRLLVTGLDRERRPTVEVAHEALIRTWPRFRGWIDVNREKLRARAAVLQAKTDWEQNGKRDDLLLPAGLPLERARTLLADAGDISIDDIKEFISLSSAREEAARKQAADLQQKRLRNRNIALAGVSLLAALAVLLGLWAYLEQREAVVASDRATSALATITDTGNTLVYDLGTQFFARGLPIDLLGRMLDRAIQGYDQAIKVNPKNSVAYVSRGFAYAIKGNNDRAIQDYNQAIQLDPKNAAAYRYRGIAYGTKGDNDRAIQDLDQAIQLDPKDAVAYASRGSAFASKGERDRAIQDFNEAIQFDPTNAAPYIGRGNAYESKGDHDRAIQDFDRSIQLNSKFPFAYVGRGDAYRSEGDHDRAIQDYDQAIQLDPEDKKNVNAYIGRGLAYVSKGDYDRAIRDYDQAIKLDPKNDNAYKNRGLAYANKGDLDRAIRDYDQAIKLDPKNALAYVSRGVTYTTRGDSDRAIQDFDQAIRLDPKNALAYVSRGVTYTTKGDSDRAIQDFDQAIRLDPKNLDAYTGRGNIYKNTGDNDRAIQDFDQAIRLNPKNAFPYIYRGNAYTNKGDNDRAIQDFDRAIQLNSKIPFGYAGRGNAYTNKGDNDRAIRDYDQAIKLDPKNALAYVSRGVTYITKGDNDRAIQDFDQAIRLDPKNFDAYTDRGAAYTNKGDNDRAIQDYDQAIHLSPTNSDAYANLGRAYFYQGNFKAAASALLRATELRDNAYSAIWRYLARKHIDENGAAELEANAARLSKDWPYPVIELYLGRRSPAEVLSIASKPDEGCEAQFYIGEWHLLRGNHAAAIPAFRAAADICSKIFSEYSGALAELERLNH